MSKSKRSYFYVTLKDGSDWRVLAKNKVDALKRVKSKKGKLVGVYFQTFKKDIVYK